MIKFYGLDYTYYDHPGKYALVLYTSGCNLRCYGCHNRNLAGWDYENHNNINKKININPKDYFHGLSEEELKLAIQNSAIELIVLCGGEILINSIESVIATINLFKSWNPDLLLRIDTNGTFPDKVNYLVENQIVDGIALDVKGPYWNSKYYPIISQVTGVSIELGKIIFPKMLNSLHIAKDLPLTLYRSVIYPIVKDDDYFDEIKKYISTHLHKPHYFSQYKNL